MAKSRSTRVTISSLISGDRISNPPLQYLSSHRAHLFAGPPFTREARLSGHSGKPFPLVAPLQLGADEIAGDTTAAALVGLTPLHVCISDRELEGV